MEFRATTAAELDPIVALMRKVFRAPADAQSLDPSLLRWKYFVPRPDWQDARSFGMFSKGSLVAHACLWPVRLTTKTGRVDARCLVDWASDPAYPGMGVLLLRKLAERYAALLSIGGSGDTRTIMPKIGFRAVSELRLYAKVIAPFRQFRARAVFTPKEFARLLRNAAWSTARLARAGDWMASPFMRQGKFPGGLPASESATSLLDPGAIEYLTACPSPRMTAYLLRRGNEHDAEGFFVSCASGGQGRLVALQISSAATADWTAAVGAAVRAIRSEPGICEVAAGTTSPRLSAALETNGFRLREKCPVFVRDPSGKLSGVAGYELNWIDDDTSYLWYPGSRFMT